MQQPIYLAIDLKSFYASVECVERGLDPITTRLVVADPERGDKTICLAITPAMKKLGIKNRCRIFEIPPNLDYITAEPRMKKYIDYSADIYSIYLSFVSKDDIHVYSIDEAFLDVTKYLTLYRMSPWDMGKAIMEEIFKRTGISSACGIGTNLYLAKVALDITAKHAHDFIGYLSEEKYQNTLWKHTPLTDFWRIGPGITKKLNYYGITTMEDIAKTEESFLYNLFGIDAELLIDHAWGKEPTAIADIKSYQAKNSCLTSGQVLMSDYKFDDGKLIAKEMMDMLCLEMVEKRLISGSITLQVGYSNSLRLDFSRGTASLPTETNADCVMVPALVALYEKIVNPLLTIKRVYITCNRVISEEYYQNSLFMNTEELERNRKLQTTMLDIKKKFGRNAILKGMSLEKNSTSRQRNRQIGGHKSGE